MTGENIDRYRKHLRARALRPATIAAYIGWVERLQRHLPVPLDQADTEHLEDWIASHDWAPNSHAKAVQAIRYFYRWMHDTGRTGSNPAATLKPAPVPAPVPNPCPDELYQQVLDGAGGDVYWRIRLAGDTGLRRAELARVHRDHVQDVAGVPRLRVDGKGGKVRWVPLPADLAAWIRLQPGWVFQRRGGGPMAAGSVGKWYSRRLGVNAHRVRHRYATNAYAGDRDVYAVRQLMGHASVKTTQQYVEVADAAVVRAASLAWRDGLAGAA